MIRTAIIFSFIGAAFAFRPAPPPGTPSFELNPEVAIEYVYLDAAVFDTIAQLVFVASFAPIKKTEISLKPIFPTDSAIIYLFDETGVVESRYIARNKAPARLKIGEKNRIIRVTDEFSIRRAITGPPGPWSYARLIQINEPFRDRKDKSIAIENVSVRLMLPPEMSPRFGSEDFDSQPLSEGFVMWEYRGNDLPDGVIFEAPEK